MNKKTSLKSSLLEDRVVSEGVTICYRYCHSRRRTLGMTVRPDKSVTVRVPLRTSLAEIRAFVTKRAGWIIKVQKDFDKHIPRPPQRYVQDSIFWYQGEEYRLKFEVGNLEAVSLSADSLVVVSPGELSEGRVRGLIDIWYRQQALDIFTCRAQKCQQMLEAEGIPLPTIVIRPMKSRWGSYSYRTRRINLNLNLIKLPQTCLDYVIIHELCHVKVRHHGPGFWKMVECYVPDHLELRKQLKMIG
ncbi:MAG TPA: SprT family zinc-dependent metalloprotease [Desulfuromonadaceae bacterium]|jgi:hypothetical protein